MKLLAIESSSLVASAAILEDDRILAEYTTDHKKTHSQTLLPMIDEIVRMTETDLGTLNAIAVSSGPGSFTGLRIGAATAKGLAMTLDIPIAAVPTLDAQAYGLCMSTGWKMPKGDAAECGKVDAKPGASGARADVQCVDKQGLLSQVSVCPIMDARRHQVYTGIYHTGAGKLEILMPSCAMDIHELLDELARRGEPVIFMGDGVPVYAREIAAACQVPYSYAPAHLSRQRAAAVATLGAMYYCEGKAVTATAFVPEYLRKSQAEREREEAEKQDGQAGK